MKKNHRPTTTVIEQYTHTVQLEGRQVSQHVDRQATCGWVLYTKTTLHASIISKHIKRLTDSDTSDIAAKHTNDSTL